MGEIIKVHKKYVKIFRKGAVLSEYASILAKHGKHGRAIKAISKKHYMIAKAWSEIQKDHGIDTMERWAYNADSESVHKMEEQH